MDEALLINKLDDDNIRIYIANKKYGLQELKYVLETEKIYDMEIIKTQWSYNYFCEIIKMYLIPDLARIIYEYAGDKICLKIISGIYRGSNELYFLPNDKIVYNFFFHKMTDEFRLHMSFCPSVYKYVITHKHIIEYMFCTCTNKHQTTKMTIDICNNIICDYGLSHSKLENIDLMCKIFKNFI